MAGFQGIFELGSSTGTLRLNNTASPLALFDLGSASAVLGNLNGAAADNFGAIEGGPATTLSGRLNGSGGTSSTYTVGALNLTTTFAGAISNAGDLQGLNITKVGTGNWILSGTSTFNGNMLIQQGTLTISGSDNNGGLDFETQTGATLALAGGAITTLSLQIDTGASFTGNGTVNAGYVNQGAANITGGAPLIVNGDFENDGTLTVGGASSLVINLPAGNSTFVNTGAITVNGSSALTVNIAPGWTGSFVNNGFLDIMDSPQSALPPGYINNGTILTSSLVTVQAYSLSGSSFSLTIQSYVGHTYQLQESTDLSTWINVGSPVTGNGSGIILTDPNATSAGMIYRIGVGP
jgi:autotransporter-associated beta strand protein